MKKLTRSTSATPAPLTALAILALLLPLAGQAQEGPGRFGSANGWTPSTVFVQVGHAEESDTVGAGATWTWNLQKRQALGTWTGYWEAAVGHWFADTDANGYRGRATEFALTPVLRLYPGGSPWGRWFVEAGVGASVITPRYRTGDKEFSTKFNFNEILGVGLRMAERHDLALRVQHFSNAGIRKPNPGETFLQLRYAYAF